MMLEIDCGELKKIAGELHKDTTPSDLIPEEGTRAFGPDFSVKLGINERLEKIRSLGEYGIALQELIDSGVQIGELGIFSKSLSQIYKENCGKKTGR